MYVLALTGRAGGDGRALKRQTDSQAQAYVRLLEENAQLKVRNTLRLKLRLKWCQLTHGTQRGSAS
jgi:hypothetical protein